MEWGKEKRWAGSVARPLSQSRLQRGVQDVVVMAVAVGVAVIALGAGIVGCFLQPHQHVHLRKKSREHEQLSVQSVPAPALFESHAFSSRLTLELQPTAEAVDKRMDSGPGLQG